MIAFWALLIGVLVRLARMGRSGPGNGRHATAGPTPQVLAERFAGGEDR